MVGRKLTRGAARRHVDKVSMRRQRVYQNTAQAEGGRGGKEKEGRCTKFSITLHKSVYVNAPSGCPPLAGVVLVLGVEDAGLEVERGLQRGRAVDAVPDCTWGGEGGLEGARG